MGNSREHSWFQQVYTDFFPKVYAFAYRHTRDAEQAEDLAHDVFLKFWQNRASFSEVIPTDAQLLTMARQLLINRYKRDIVRQRVYANWQQQTPETTAVDDTEHLLQTEELTSRLQAALENLPPKRREIFEKSRFEHLSYAEIAQQLGISPATVESQMVKALKTLREKLAVIFLLFL
ncbi:RNA polymerase sigma-70 factor [Fibrella sp. WM1]|uniref:RNA polymerase sigma-70 factor n=1 Tax=Fibrella musci TaxID=3242485 RepID=UPI003522C3F7